MSLYCFSSGLSWEQYLQANSFIQDSNKTIRKTGEQIRYIISDQTKRIVASHGVLSRTFQEGFDQVNGTLVEGFGIVGRKLEDIREGIEQLGAAFSYGMSLLAQQLEVQTQLLGGVIKLLDAIHETLQSPTLTQAREFYNIGRERLQKGLLDKALESFLKAENANDADFLTQYSLGHLYLYGKDAENNVVDLPKAEKHFRNAARYAKAEMVGLPEARKFCGEAYFHASVACYAQATEKHQAGNTAEAERLIHEAASLAKQAMEVYPRLAESFYQYARTCALLGEVRPAVQSLGIAIKADRNYCLKADIDRDFDSIRPSVLQLFEVFRQRARGAAKKALDEMRQLVDSYGTKKEIPRKIENLDKIRLSVKAQLIRGKIENILNKVEEYYQNGTYFDYLEVLESSRQTKEMAIQSLKMAIRAQQTYTIDIDRDFDNAYSQVLELFNTLRQRTEKEITKILEEICSLLTSYGSRKELAEQKSEYLAEVRHLLDSYVFLTTKAQQTKGKIEELLKEIDEFYQSGSYFDYLEALENAKQIKNLIEAFSSFEPLTVLRGHTRDVCSVSFSPDGRYLASGSFDHTVRLWEAPSWRELVILQGYTSYVRSISFSPDGWNLVSGSEDKTIRSWEVPSWRKRVTRWHTKSVNSVSFSPDGRYLASGNGDGTVRLWELPSWKELITLQGHTGTVHSVSFSPDGKYLASGSWDNTIQLWEVSSWRQIVTCQKNMGPVYSVSFSPDGQYLASGSHDHMVRLWGVLSGEELATLQGHTDAVHSVSFSPDGQYLASGGYDQTIWIWEVSSGKALITLQGHTDHVRCVSFSPDGRYLASGSEDKTIWLWERQIISRQDFEALEGRKRLQEKERKRLQEERRRLQEDERKRQEEEHRRQEEERKHRETERNLQRQLRIYRLQHNLCLECGAKLGFFEKKAGNTKCKNCR